MRLESSLISNEQTPLGSALYLLQLGGVVDEQPVTCG